MRNQWRWRARSTRRRSPNRSLSHSLAGALRGSWKASHRRHDRIRQGDANASDLRVRARRVDTVAEKNDEHVAIRVNPDRRPRKAGVPERAVGHQVARRIVAVRLLPSEGSIRYLAGGEASDRLGSDNSRGI